MQQPRAREAMPESSPQPDRDGCVDNTSFLVPLWDHSRCASSFPGPLPGLAGVVQLGDPAQGR